VHGSIPVVGRVSDRIAELVGNRHNVHGVGTCDRPQWTFDAGFYFEYKGYISFDSLCYPPEFKCEAWKIFKNYKINWLQCQKNIDIAKQIN
jgi:hypothetical protein